MHYCKHVSCKKEAGCFGFYSEISEEKDKKIIKFFNRMKAIASEQESLEELKHGIEEYTKRLDAYLLYVSYGFFPKEERIAWLAYQDAVKSLSRKLGRNIYRDLKDLKKDYEAHIKKSEANIKK